MFAHPGDLVDRHVAVRVDLPSQEPAQRRRAILQRQEDLAVERHLRRGVEIAVLDEHQLVVRRVALQRERAICDQTTGTREAVAPLLDVRAIDRQRGHVRELREQVGRGMREVDLQRQRVVRGHAQRLDRHLAGIHGAGVLQVVEDRGVLRAGLRVHQPAHRVDEVVGGHRRAVRPARVGAQVERVGELVGGDLPARGDAGDQRAMRVAREQALVHLGEHVGLRRRRDLGRVERAGVGDLAPPPDPAGVRGEGQGEEGEDPDKDAHPLLPLREKVPAKPAEEGAVPERTCSTTTPHPPFGHLLPQGEKADHAQNPGRASLRRPPSRTGATRVAKPEAPVSTAIPQSVAGPIAGS